MIIVAGPVGIFIGAAVCKWGASSTLSIANYVNLGQSRDGCQVTVQNKTHRIVLDDMGGQQGAPADVLALGSSAQISTTIVDFGSPNMQTSDGDFAKLMWGIMSGYRVFSTDYDEDGNIVSGMSSEGDLPAPGTPLFDTGYGFSLYLASHVASQSLFFPKCTLAASPRSWNHSSREKTLQLTITAYEVPYATSTGNTSLYDARLLFKRGQASGATSATYQCRTAEQGTTSGAFADLDDDEEDDET